jgi:methionyl-tRNA formyltransferase
MKVVFITGSHSRHAYIARALAETGFLAGLIIEQREEHVPTPPCDLRDDVRDIFVKHFEKRQQAEAKFFSQGKFPDVPTLLVSKAKLNSALTWEFLEEYSPELLLSYGCHMLTKETLMKVAGEKWNIHGGLSPWYRGAITHFWPSYLLEPQMTGMTIHELTQQLDAGDVVHQCTADLIRGDGLHELAARAVVKVSDDLKRLLMMMQKGDKIQKTAHKSAGKLWLGSDWKPEHLKVIYQLYQDKIVDHYLDGCFTQSNPKLIRQFD